MGIDQTLSIVPFMFGSSAKMGRWCGFIVTLWLHESVTVTNGGAVEAKARLYKVWSNILLTNRNADCPTITMH